MTAHSATVDTVVFDLDGTLVDSAFHHALAGTAPETAEPRTAGPRAA